MIDKRIIAAREALELVAARHLGKFPDGAQTAILQAVIGLQQLTEESPVAQRIIGVAASPKAMRANKKGKTVRNGDTPMGCINDVPEAEKPNRRKGNKRTSN